MRKQLMAVVLVGSMAAVGAATAQDGAKLAEAAGCGKCHAVDRKKMGPTYKAIAANFKKAGVSGDAAVARLKATHEAEDLKTIKSAADMKAIMAWVLSH